MRTKKTINKMLSYDLSKESGFMPPTDSICPFCDKEIDTSLALQHVLNCFGSEFSNILSESNDADSEKAKKLVPFYINGKYYNILEFVLFLFIFFSYFLLIIKNDFILFTI